jgi:hypothetical protein
MNKSIYYFIFSLTLVILFIIHKLNEYYTYVPTPVVSESQNYNWYTAGNPNLAFAPAVHFVKPDLKECLKFVEKHYDNLDERFTKLIECIQNRSGAPRRKNLPISSPGTGEYFYF